MGVSYTRKMGCQVENTLSFGRVLAIHCLPTVDNFGAILWIKMWKTTKAVEGQYLYFIAWARRPFAACGKGRGIAPKKNICWAENIRIDPG
jgi:hypothetical protein